MFCVSFNVNAAPNHLDDSNDAGRASGVRWANEDESAAATSRVPADMERRETLTGHDSLSLDDNGRRLIWDNEYLGYGAFQRACASDLFEEIEIWDCYRDGLYSSPDVIQELGEMRLQNLKVLRLKLRVAMPAEDHAYRKALENMPELRLEFCINHEPYRSFVVGSQIKPAAKGRMQPVEVKPGDSKRGE